MGGKSAPKINLDDLESTLGYRFKDRQLLSRALTHKSALDANQFEASLSYQRLEFLGDRVLALTIADMVFNAFPEAEEGELARRLTGLVRNETCADVANDWDLHHYIRVSEGERRSGGHKREAIIGDVCEAVLAAVYLDGGLKVASALIERHWRERMMSWTKPLRDPKTALQEWAHGRKLPIPTYREVSRSGPDHALTFVIEVDVKSNESARGEGTSKREAQQKAASKFLIREGIWERDHDDKC